MKNFKKATVLLTAALTLSSCGTSPKAKAIQETRDAITNHKNYDKEYERVKYASYYNSGLTFDVYFYASNDDQDRFDAISKWQDASSGLCGDLVVIFTDSSEPEVQMGIYKDYSMSVTYFVAELNLPDKYTIGSTSYDIVFSKASYPEYFSYDTGYNLLKLSLTITLKDLKEFMSTYNIDIKTFLPNA